MNIIIDAAAKINLLLDITGELDNGYHSLFMIMQSVDLFDTVTLEKTDSGTVELTCSEPSLPCDKRNIAVKAALNFFTDAGIKNEGLKIHIEKRIPLAAGLAGGSADAAAVICGLNKMYKTELCETALCTIGLKVGSDVPFCISGGTRLVENVGDKMCPLPAFGDFFIVLAKPAISVSTAAAYAAFNDLETVVHPDNEAMLKAVREQNGEDICRYAANVFEQVVTFPEFESIRSAMESNGASLVRMSGSGPTVFGLFRNEEDALKAEAEIRQKEICQGVFTCRPINRGVIIR